MEQVTSKTCTKCAETKPLSEFYVKPRGKYGRAAHCKECHKADGRARPSRPSTEASRARNRAWARDNPQKNAARARKWRAANPEAWAAIKLRNNQKRRATKAGATTGPVDPVAVGRAYSHCYLCGEDLHGKVHLDHVVPLSRGGAHCNANLRPTHERCNLRKSDRLLSELPWYEGPTDLGVVRARV